MIVLVNPNSPTGQHASLHGVAQRAKAQFARFGKPYVWVDETYIDYVSDVGAGLRLGYLVGDVSPLRPFIPPWAVSLPAQLAGTIALRDTVYYAARREEVRVERDHLRADLAAALERLQCHVRVKPGCANFFLLELPPHFPADATRLVTACRARGVFLRPFGAQWVRVAVRSHEENRRIVEAVVAEVSSAVA